MGPSFAPCFALFPLGGTLTSFVRTITPLTLGIKTWNLCGLIRFRAEFILSLWKAKRQEKDTGCRLYYEFAVFPDRYIKNKCWGWSHLNPPTEWNCICSLGYGLACEVRVTKLSNHSKHYRVLYINANFKPGFCKHGDNVSPLSLNLWQGYTCKYGLPDYLQSTMGWSLNLCIHASRSTLKLVTHNVASSSPHNAAGITLAQLSW